MRRCLVVASIGLLIDEISSLKSEEDIECILKSNEKEKAEENVPCTSDLELGEKNVIPSLIFLIGIRKKSPGKKPRDKKPQKKNTVKKVPSIGKKIPVPTKYITLFLLLWYLYIL